MYKIFGFVPDPKFGRVAEVEFSLREEGAYAYLLGSFNAFNEGSFRMKRKDDGWSLTVRLPEGVHYYGFSVDGEFLLDPDNPEKRRYIRDSYKFDREVSVARILGSEKFFHAPSLTHLYSFAGRTHVLFRSLKGERLNVTLRTGGREFEMRFKASDELFDYYETVLDGVNRMRYSFIISSEKGVSIYGPFDSEPYSLEAPRWALEGVFYQIMPDRFKSTGISRKRGEFYGGDLYGVLEGISHVEWLGANAIYLTPIFEATTYHRYDVTDYFSVGRDLGGDEAFENLLEEIRRRDMRVVLDGVFHHTSFFHPYFQDLIKNGRKSRYRNFYRVLRFPVVSEKFLEVLKEDLPINEKSRILKRMGWNYESFYSVWLMPRLNHESGEVQEFVRDVMLYWIKKGVDGWRLDVAHGVPPEFWRKIRKAMPEDVYIFGEVMDDARLWVPDAFHGTMNYPLYDLVLAFFVKERIDAKEFLNGLELLSVFYGPSEYLMFNFLDNHDTERFIDLVDDEKRFMCAMAFLMTYKGIPSILYGDEIGLRGGGEGLSAGRSPMEWDRKKWNPRILKGVRNLISIRRGSDALKFGLFRPVLFRGRVLVYERIHKGEHILVGINCSGEDVRVSISASRAFSGENLRIPALSYVILKSGE